MGEELVSIIVPIYNTSLYISDLIKSVQEQKYKNYELILIDDGSIDNSKEICEKYLEKDKRISLFIKKNEGVSKARNFGLSKANGKYIYFVDSDDILNEDCILSFIKEAENYDLICSGYYEMFVNKIIEKKIINFRNEIKKEEILMGVLNNNNIRGFLWNKFFKKDIIDKYDIKFQEDIKFLEDALFVCEYISHCNKICVIPQCLYYYRMRKSSSVYSSNKIESVRKAYIKLEKYYKNINEIYWYNYLMFYYNNKLNLNSDEKYIKNFWKVMFARNISKKCKIKLVIYRFNPKIFKTVLKLKIKQNELFV